MNDERLRELERRWRTEPSVENEAAWLDASLRGGELSLERLSVAAYCGHAASRRVIPSAALGDPSLLPWLEGLGAFERRVLERACTLMARLALPIWERRFHETLDVQLAETAARNLASPELDPADAVGSLGALPRKVVESLESRLAGAEVEPISGAGICENHCAQGSPAAHAAIVIDFSQAAVLHSTIWEIHRSAVDIARHLAWALEADEASEDAPTHWSRIRHRLSEDLCSWALGPDSSLGDEN